MTAEFTPFLLDLVRLLGWLVLAIFLDVFLAVVIALRDGKFRWEQLASFLRTYGPYVAAWIALEMLNLLPLEFQTEIGLAAGLGRIVYFLVMTSAVASVLGHVQALGLLGQVKLTRLGIPPTAQSSS